MKLTCLQENLNKGLAIVGRAAAARTTLPITNNVLLSAEDSRLKLVATNLEMAISCFVKAKIDEEGAITVPSRLLTEFIASLPNDKVEVTLGPRTKTLKLKCARFEARISGVDARDFPPVPKVSEGITTTVAIDEIRQAISQVAMAAAADESRPVLTGVNAEFDGSQLTLAAADGFRLAVYKLPLSKPLPTKTTAIIPARALSELARLAADQEEDIGITLDTVKSQIVFNLKNIELVSQLIQGSFPEYSQLIPKEFQTRAIVDTASFLSATKTAAIFARDGGGIVRLIVTPGAEKTPGRLTLSSRSEELGEDVGDIDTSVQGEAAKIAFNGKYLMDVLGVIRQSQVALEVTSSSSPGIIRPVGDENYVHVIMPMFVQWD